MNYGLYAHPHSLNVTGYDAMAGVMFHRTDPDDWFGVAGLLDGYQGGQIARRCNQALAFKHAGLT